VLSGDRTSRDRETHGAVPGKQTPKSRWSKVNLGEFPLAARTSTYQFPECRNSEVTRARHLDSTMLRGPTLLLHLRDFADRGTHDSKSFAAEIPECRISDTPDSCHLSLQELTVPIKSGDRTSRIRRAWDYCTRQPRFADARW
jgi:hypothetical protein